MNQASSRKSKLLFLLLGIGLILGSIAGFFYDRQVQASRKEADALIVEIENSHNTDENVSHNVYIEFETDDGQLIRTTLGSYSNSMEVGDTVTVRYDPEEPTNLSSTTSGITLVLICGGMGLALTGFSIYSMTKKQTETADLAVHHSDKTP